MKLYRLSAFDLRWDVGGAGKVYKSSVVQALYNIRRKRRGRLFVGIALRGFGVERYLIHDIMAE
jgi:hypothetical protein